jgi:hypothetical protein
VTEAEQRQVLSKRKGRALTRRIILKSYLSSAPDPGLPRGTPDVRKADGLPVYTVGNCSVEGLRRLLALLGAGGGGATEGGAAAGASCTVVLTDVREELVVYVNGLPYIRRWVVFVSAVCLAAACCLVTCADPRERLGAPRRKACLKNARLWPPHPFPSNGRQAPSNLANKRPPRSKRIAFFRSQGAGDAFGRDAPRRGALAPAGGARGGAQGGGGFDRRLTDV